MSAVIVAFRPVELLLDIVGAAFFVHLSRVGKLPNAHVGAHVGACKCPRGCDWTASSPHAANGGDPLTPFRAVLSGFAGTLVSVEFSFPCVGIFFRSWGVD
jgi:hypothetical protein